MTVAAFSGWLIHLSCLLALFSFWVRDILWLRVLAVGSSTVWIASMYIGSHVIPESLFWSSVFIGINLWRIGQLMYESRSIAFSDEERDLYAGVFANFKPVEFHRLIRAAKWRDIPAGATLVAQGAEPGGIFLLARGRLRVSRNGQPIAELRPHEFVGELSYLSGEHATADVTSLEPVRLLHWEPAPLRSLFLREPSLQYAFQSLLNTDLARKLRRDTAAKPLP